jgi:FlaA1/EpsC-like NDP-sugar epimerase
MPGSGIHMDLNFVEGKTILVTGGTGSIGSEIVRALGSSNAKTVRILSNDENGVFQLAKEHEGPKFRFFVGDVRDKDRMKMACEDVDIVFHAAALKHVPLCEYNPSEAVKTNVNGTQNMIEACLEHEVEKMIFISTDKAVEPVNTMGATKLLAEKLVVDATFYKGFKKSAFSIVRFGNVLASRGSVVPLFVEQARNGKEITLTSKDMTRFLMFIPDAIRLIFKAAEKAEGGEIFTFKMPVARMMDIAEVVRDMVSEINGQPPVPITIIGMRPGERLHEVLMTGEEAERAIRQEELILIPPMNPNIPGRKFIQKEPVVGQELKELYRSELATHLTKDEIRKMIEQLNIL